jgi:hypothetical protein
MAEPNRELKTYYGNCHCGAFKFNVELPEMTSARTCNCSICFRTGGKWLFPSTGCFTIEKGEETLKNYEFGLKTLEHKVYLHAIPNRVFTQADQMIVLPNLRQRSSWKA